MESTRVPEQRREIAAEKKTEGLYWDDLHLCEMNYRNVMAKLGPN